jgi:uncharacterized protein YbjT (DUF2867 family)
MVWDAGAVVARELLSRGKKVRAVARRLEPLADLEKRGAEIVRGDVLDAASVEAALEGAEGAYLLLPPDVKSDDLVARNRRIADIFAAALTKRGVRHAALLSSVGAHEPAGTGPIVTAHYAEQALARASSTTLTFVRAAYFMENILAYTSAMKADGVLPVFGGGEGTAFPMVATADIGRVAAEALSAPPSATEIIELSGPRDYSFADAARIATTVLGRAVTAVPLPLDGLVPAFTGFGMSTNVAGLYREMTEALGKGLVRYDGQGRSVRGSTSLDDVMRAALAR